MNDLNYYNLLLTWDKNSTSYYVKFVLYKRNQHCQQTHFFCNNIYIKIVIRKFNKSRTSFLSMCMCHVRRDDKVRNGSTVAGCNWAFFDLIHESKANKTFINY